MAHHRSVKELAREVFGHPMLPAVKKLKRFDTAKELERRGCITLMRDLVLLDRIAAQREEARLARLEEQTVRVIELEAAVMAVAS